MGEFPARLSREVPQRAASGMPLTELDVQAKQLAFRLQQPRLCRAEFRHHFRFRE